MLETIQSQQLRRPRSATPSSARRRKLPSNDIKVTKALLLVLKERRELEAKKREIMLERRVRESVLNNRAAKKGGDEGGRGDARGPQATRSWWRTEATEAERVAFQVRDCG